MKARLLTLLLFMIPVSTYAQVDVSIPITVSTDAGQVKDLHIRIADNAINLISVADGFDVITAPVPPNSQYDVRLRNPDLPSITDATTDARKIPTTVSDVFKYDIIYQPGSGATGVTQITFSWNPADIAAIPEIEDLILKDNIVGSIIGPIDMTTTSSYTTNSADPFYDLDLRIEMTFNNLFLPVELTRLESRSVANSVWLEWTTATETNNSGFEILRASPLASDEWNSMGFVTGNGTTTEENDYSFQMDGLDPGVHHFRLKQIDFDGKYELSQVIETVVDLPSSHSLSSAYPNPFNPQAGFSLSVKESSNVVIALYDGLGKKIRTIYSGSIRGGQTKAFTIDGTDLSSGIYLYRVQGLNTSNVQFDESKRVTLIK